jgi:hypothetical protein
VLDLYGGIHPFGNAPTLATSAYWNGWDIARDIVLRTDNTGGYVRRRLGRDPPVRKRSWNGHQRLLERLGHRQEHRPPR